MVTADITSRIRRSSEALDQWGLFSACAGRRLAIFSIKIEALRDATCTAMGYPLRDRESGRLPG